MADAQSQSGSEKAEIIKKICSESIAHIRVIGAELWLVDRARRVKWQPIRRNVD